MYVMPFASKNFQILTSRQSIGIFCSYSKKLSSSHFNKNPFCRWWCTIPIKSDERPLPGLELTAASKCGEKTFAKSAAHETWEQKKCVEGDFLKLAKISAQPLKEGLGCVCVCISLYETRDREDQQSVQVFKLYCVVDQPRPQATMARQGFKGCCGRTHEGCEAARLCLPLKAKMFLLLSVWVCRPYGLLGSMCVSCRSFH